MDFVLKNGFVYENGVFVKKDVFVKDKKIFFDEKKECEKAYNIDGLYVFPGFCDVHVHLREPGFSYKETIKTGTLAAAHGGYTTVFTMPNLSPVPDSKKSLQKQLDIIKNDALINVIPYGAITVGEKGEELSDMEAMNPYVCGFSDDGRGIQNEEIMKEAMIRANKLNKVIAAHCEDDSLVKGGYINDGEYAKIHNHKGICNESEYEPVRKNIITAENTKCKYHVCHVSTKETVELIRQAKKRNIDITCETAPHYLVLTENDLKEDGRFKMNPPLRTEADRQALIEGIKDNTIDIIATDHAPHSLEEKSRGLEKSLMGVVGLETAFCMVYTSLVKTKIITLKKLIELLWKNPLERFGMNADFCEGSVADLCVFDINEKFVIDENEFFSKGRSTPFGKKEAYGKCKLTVCKGEIVWQENLTEK